MGLKHTIKELSTFSKKERIAIIIILFIVLIVALLPFYNFGSQRSNETVLDSSLVAESHKLKEPSNENDSILEPGVSPTNYQIDKAEDADGNSSKIVLFTFDPNILDSDGFKKLGLRDRTIKTILNYRNKGGNFRKPDDFKKIYNLRQDEFERLKPYISIESANHSKSNSNVKYQKLSTTNAVISENKPKYQRKIIEINMADAAAYESLYGIGNKLALRIINFREKLGGFYSIDQVGETYGVPDSTFQKIKSQLKLSSTSIRKININSTNYDELNGHPYINKRTAYLILKQRKEKGNFQSIEEVRNIVSQTNDSFEKIAPYIKID
ncbi:ComEA family DNA-binding protein [Niabella ginsengisoli]|uniref:Helix-hairpin-helix domain-containing protein n=1 Tax=Niabella ginsengisoli TaxID=522298 RepID=A0ABS9SQF8_9BACT|nr:helix-hairpin-helix domain-containing protein [Niabella ginsengisoli]MCH5600633.1 helix-hairpin-helix domain-containing protein [Niabella ginsengisoli]